MSAITGCMWGWELGAGKKRENNKYNPRAVNHSNKCGENIVGPNRKTVSAEMLCAALFRERNSKKKETDEADEESQTANLEQHNPVFLNSHWPRRLLVFSTSQMFVLWGQKKVNMFYCNRVTDLFTAFSNATQTKKIYIYEVHKNTPKSTKHQNINWLLPGPSTQKMSRNKNSITMKKFRDIEKSFLKQFLVNSQHNATAKNIIFL